MPLQGADSPASESGLSHKCIDYKVLVGIAGNDGPWNSQSRISSTVEPGARLAVCSPASDLDGKPPAESRAQPQGQHYGYFRGMILSL